MATVKELRAKAKSLFFKGYSKMNKAELEKLISDYEASEEAFRDIDPSIHAPEATTQPEQPQPTQPIIPDEILTVYNWERLLKDCITYEDFRRILNTGTMKALVEIASNFKNFNQPTHHQKCKSWYVDGIADIISFRESEEMQAILSIKPKCSLIGLSLKDQKKAIAQCATEEEIIALLWTLPDWKAIEDLGFALKLISYPHLVISLANAERMKYKEASSLAASIWNEREKEKDRTEFLASQPEGLLGMFTFSYSENKEKKSVVLSVEKKDTRDFQDNLKIYMGNVYLDIKDSKGNPIAHYVPYLDRFDFSRDIDWLFPSYCNWTRAILFMEQFRKVVPDYLRKMNLLNKEGELISDGAEAFRVLFYQHWRISRNKEDFSMPDNPFSEGNDENNPLTWKDTPYRDKALAVYHGILYYQIEAEDAQRDKTKARSKYTVSKIETLKKKLHALYMKSQEQPSAPQPEVVAVQDVTPEVIRVEFSQPESVVEQDTTEAPTIETSLTTPQATVEHDTKKLTADNWRILTQNCKTPEDLRAVLSSASWRTLAQIATSFEDFVRPSKATNKNWYLDAITDIVFFDQDEKIRHISALKPTCSLVGLTREQQKEVLELSNTPDEILALLWTLPDWRAIDKLSTMFGGDTRGKVLWEPNKARMKQFYAYRLIDIIISHRKKDEEKLLSLTAYVLQRDTESSVLEHCPHCGSIHKPYFSYRHKNNWALCRSKFANGGEAKEWFEATLTCRNCGHKVSICYKAHNSEPIIPRGEAFKFVAKKWCEENKSKATHTEQPATPQATAEQAPKVKASAPKLKPRKTRRKYDDTRTLSLGFDEDNPTEISSQVAISNPQSNTQKSTAGNQSSTQSSTTKHRRKPRVKYDDSRQILIGFDVEILSGESDQRQAA